MAFKCECGHHKIIIDNANNKVECENCGSVFINDDDGNILISRRNGDQFGEPETYLSLDDDNRIICS